MYLITIPLSGIVNNKFIIRYLTLFISFLIFVSIFGCNHELKKEEVSTLPIIIIKAKDTIVQKTVVAEIQANKNVEIRARIQGYLEQILVDEGAHVTKGQPLFKLSSPEYTADYTKAKASLLKAMAEEKSTHLEVERVRILVNKNIIAKSELVLAESKLSIAKATVTEASAVLKNAEAFLSFTTISAPFTGVIDRIPLKVGSLISQGSLLTTISDITSMVTYFHISEIDYLKYLKSKSGTIPTNQDLTLLLADGSEYNCKGKIEMVGGEINNKTGVITFRARFNNPNSLLKHGASGTILLKSEISRVILIPQKAVIEIQDKNYVFLVDAKNRVKMKSFTSQQRLGNFYLVKLGVQENDKIVVEGVQNLRDGLLINPKLVRLK